MKRQKFALCSVYDTETCNVGQNENTRAYPVLFIDNDIRDIDISDYEPDRDDKVAFYRTETEMQTRIDEYVKWGRICNVVPIICAYNLIFDLRPLLYELNRRYDIKVNAQSSTSVYTLDLLFEDTDTVALRFWDTFHLEMRGLKAMGETCGLAKANGDWDYSLIRTPDTPLTEEELHYANRDVQVIPAYLKYLLHANEWMRQDWLGTRIITKTSIVRQMAKKKIANLKVCKRNEKMLTLDKAFSELCNKELPKNYGTYALRKSCFRGGFTFTAALTAHTVVKDVVSVDVTSMHHTFINGRMIPQDFEPQEARVLQVEAEKIVTTTREHVMNNYEKPFDAAIHACIKFNNIRLRKGSCFEKWGIALEPMSKFQHKVEAGEEIGFDPRAVEAENSIKGRGWHDTFSADATFAFGKLYEAKQVCMHLSELELWALSRVYEWDTMEVLYGEGTIKWKYPPDYVTLQSNMLFEMKSAVKFIIKHYRKGEPYVYNLSGIPDGIAYELRAGTMEPQFLEAWYSNTVKGQFNGIYGTQAQDIYKPDYRCDRGIISVDKNTITTPDNFDAHQPNTCRVLYTYGMRIVGGSRLHMCIALELLYESLGARVVVTGGDTDSMKIACDYSVTDDMIESALEPIAKCSKAAIDKAQYRLRKSFPDMASTLKGIGAFEVENRGGHYEYHMELWNKARISWDGNHTHVTMAGLPRPIGAYTVESLADELCEKCGSVEKAFTSILGFNVYVDNAVSHVIESHTPSPADVFDSDVRDYLGNVSHVRAHESSALYSAGRWLGELDKGVNYCSWLYMIEKYGRTVETRNRYLYKGSVYMDTDRGLEKVL